MDRHVVCLSVQTLADLSVEHLVPADAHFALLLLYNARGVEAATIGAVATRLIDAGLATFHAWGPDCERVHDIMDELIVARDIRENCEYPTIMTSWYPDCPIEEALSSLIISDTIDEAYAATCDTTIIITVGNHDWEREVKRLLRVGICPMARSNGVYSQGTERALWCLFHRMKYLS